MGLERNLRVDTIDLSAFPEAPAVIALRLVVARAASSDGLRWWDDHSLTEAGLQVARRVFSRAPQMAACHLAMRAATARHHAAITNVSGATHLFSLGERFELLVSDRLADEEFDIPAPIASMDEFRAALGELGVNPDVEPRGMTLATNNAAELHLALSEDPLTVARALAGAYLLGEPERPVFPFIRPSTPLS